MPIDTTHPPFILLSFNDREVADEIARQAEVAADLARYLDTGGPDPEELAAAPRMEAWSLLRMPGCLIATGIIFGHPRLGSGRPGHTSEIVALARDGSWARSRNRLWCLAEPALPAAAGQA